MKLDPMYRKVSGNEPCYARGMARPLRMQFAGAVYHVMGRGNARQTVFLDDEDYQRFLRLLRRVITRLDWQIWAYCLMPNHYHVLVETPTPTLSRGMHDLVGHYSQTFNARHDRVGHVFQGRFKCVLVDKESYLLQLSRYIVLNPVDGGLCQAPESWRWSSYLSLFGRTDPVVTQTNAARLLRQFGPAEALARNRLRAFVMAGLGDISGTETALNRSILGDETFVEQVAARVEAPSTEVCRPDRIVKSLSEVARTTGGRNEAIRAAYATGMFSQKAIADHFGVHYSTVSRVVSVTNAAIQDLTPS